MAFDPTIASNYKRVSFFLIRKPLNTESILLICLMRIPMKLRVLNKDTRGIGSLTIITVFECVHSVKVRIKQNYCHQYFKAKVF